MQCAAILILLVAAASAAAQPIAPALGHMSEAAEEVYEADRGRVRESAILLERQDIIRHEIDATVDPNARSLTAVDRLTVALTGDVLELALDPALTVVAVEDGAGRPLDFFYDEGALDVTVPGDGRREATVVVSYRGRGLTAGHPGGGATFFMLPPEQAWYPNATGRDPALLTLVVRYPAGLASVCTGTLSGMVSPSETTEAHPVGDVWETQTPIRAAALLVTSLESEWGFRGSAGVSFHRRATREGATELTMGDVKVALRFLESCYGPYPFDWLHIVVTEPGAGPAHPLDGPGLVVLPSTVQGGGNARALLTASLASSFWEWSIDVAPLVSDGLAAHAELMWLQSAGDEEEVRRRRELRRYQYVRALIESGGWLPLSGCVGTEPCDDPRLSRGKGAAFFDVLQHVVEHDVLCAGLRRVREEWSGSVAPFGRVIGSVEDVAGRSLDWFVYDWVVRGDLPTYSLQYETTPTEGGRHLVRGTIRQDGEAYRTPLPLTIDLGGWSYEEWIEIESADQTFELVTETRPLDLVVDASRIIPKVDPKDRARAHHELGLAAVERNEWGRAVDELGAAARLMPERSAYWFDYGQALIRSGRQEPGIEAVERAVRLSTDTPHRRSFLTRIYLSAGRYEDALENVDILLDASPGDFEHLSDRAVALVGLGRLDEAEKVLTRARARLDESELPAATSERFYLAVGIYHEAAGALDEADAAYRYALRMNPLSDDARRGIERVRELRETGGGS